MLRPWEQLTESGFAGGTEGLQLASETRAADALYENRVNPQWVKLLNILQMNVRYRHCAGTELITEDGRRILDFLRLLRSQRRAQPSGDHRGNQG